MYSDAEAIVRKMISSAQNAIQKQYENYGLMQDPLEARPAEYFAPIIRKMQIQEPVFEREDVRIATNLGIASVSADPNLHLHLNTHCGIEIQRESMPNSTLRVGASFQVNLQERTLLDNPTLNFSIQHKIPNLFGNKVESGIGFQIDSDGNFLGLNVILQRNPPEIKYRRKRY